MKAYVKWPDTQSAARPGFRGIVVISQKNESAPAKYKVRLSGLPPNSLHGFHIHEKPVVSQADLDKTCATCGGHFNPNGEIHGSVLSKQPSRRHAGDLINNVWADENGDVVVNFTDDLATLLPTEQRPWTVVGKSLVVHVGIDDLGVQGEFHPLPPYVNGKKPCVFVNDPSVKAYEQDDPRWKSSLENGNAGKRLACGNIKLYPLEKCPGDCDILTNHS